MSGESAAYTGPYAQSSYDVVVVGGGHNGLVSAAYLAQAGMSVLVLERLDQVGGAATSSEQFPGLPARVSTYASLISLLPDRIGRDLGLDLQFRSRRTSSYTPAIRGGRHTGLLVERVPGQPTSDSFRLLTGSDREFTEWSAFAAELKALAAVVAPTLLEPLPTADQMHARIAPETWQALVEQPLGVTVEKRFLDDVVRGLVASDGLIGTFTDLHDPDLGQNRTFLHHTIGNGTGEWRVPIGGMGAVSTALERSVRNHGGEILTRAFVTEVESDGRRARVGFRSEGVERSVEATWVLGNVAPWVLRILLGEHPGPRPEGSGIRINMLLEKLPRLRSGVSPPMALSGTLRIGEGYEQIQQSFLEAQEGYIPEVPPGELFCHSLTDPSVLGTLATHGKHAFSYFGLHTPARLYSGHVDAQRDETVLRILDAVNVHFEEPIESLLALDAQGNPCLKAMAPQDVEAALAMPGGHIFHGPLHWPWADDSTPLDTPARRWGVETPVDNILLCGSGARRGGSVSGVAGHNAAMAVLEATGRLAPQTV